MSATQNDPLPGQRLDASLVTQTVPPGSLRYYAQLYAPAAKREVLTALWLLEDELDATARGTHHDVAHTRLKWWSDEIDRLGRHKAAHPATRALAQARETLGESQIKLRSLVEAAAMDLALITYADKAELDGYLDRSGGTCAELAARWLLAPVTPSAMTLVSVRRLGALIRRVETLRDLRTHATAGRVHFSLASLDSAGIDIQELRATPWSRQVQDFLLSTCAELKLEFASTVAALPADEGTALRPLLVMASLHNRLLDHFARESMKTAPRPPELGPFEKLWFSWRAARRAAGQHRRAK